MSPHYVAHCEGCGANKTLTRPRVETGRIVMCQPCDRGMTVINIGDRPKPARTAAPHPNPHPAGGEREPTAIGES